MLSPRRVGRLACAAALVVLVTACGDEGTGTAQPPVSAADTTPAAVATTDAGTITTDSPPATDAPPTTAGPATDVPEILQFSAPLVGGATFDGAAHGGTPLALWFWAPG